MRLLFTSLGVLLLGCGQNASSQVDNSERQIGNPIQIPTFSAGNDEVVSENARITEACRVEVLKTFPDIKIERLIVTKSELWGFVWRADVVVVNDRKGRLVCWSPQEVQTDKVLLNSKFRDTTDKPLP